MVVLLATILASSVAEAITTPESTCGPCSGGIDAQIVPCDLWRHVSGRTGPAGSGDADMLYEFEATEGVTYVFSFCEEGGAYDYDTSLAIFDSSSSGCVGSALDCSDDACGPGSRLEWIAPRHGTFIVRVGGYSDYTGSFTLAYRGVGSSCDDLRVTPLAGLSSTGRVGGPFASASLEYTLKNNSEAPVEYRVSTMPSWIRLAGASGRSPATIADASTLLGRPVVQSGHWVSLGDMPLPGDQVVTGTLAPNETTTVTVTIGPDACSLLPGVYSDTVSFTNLTDGQGSTTRAVSLRVLPDLEYPSGLVSYWSFDEGSGTAAYDTFGTNHGAIHDATWTSGQVGAALHFSWDQWVEVADATSLNPQTAMSVEGWVQIDSPPGLYKIFDKDGYWSTYRGYSGTISYEPLLSFQLFGHGQVSYSPPGGFPDVWFHFAMVHDGNVATVYFNGMPMASQPIAGPINQRNDRPLYIGREDGASEFMNGKIDELALYDRALTVEEVAEHYARSLAGQSYFEPVVMSVEQLAGLVASGTAGGPFSPASAAYTVTNRSTSAIDYSISRTASWLSLDGGSGPSDGPLTGTLAPSASLVVSVLIDADANTLAPGTHTDTVSFTNLTDGRGNTTRPVSLRVFDPACLFVDDDNTGGIEDGTLAHPFNTIQEAVNAAPVGGRVCVLAGLYAETVVVGKNGLTVEGEGASGSGAAVLDAGGAETALFVHADDVIVKDLEVRNATRKGVELQGAHRCRIASNRVHGISSPYGLHAYGIFLQSSTDNRIESNEVFDVTSPGGHEPFPWSAGGGVLLEASDRNEVRSNRIHHLTSSTAYAIGIIAHASNQLILASNEIHDTDTSGDWYVGSYSEGIDIVLCDNAQILGNRIQDIRSSTHYARGIVVQESHGVSISGNIVHDIRSPGWEIYGIELYSTSATAGSAVTVENNEVYNLTESSYGGLGIADIGLDATIRGNRVHACKQGIHVNAPGGTLLGAAIQNNEIFECWSGISLDSSGNTAEGNTVRQNGTGIQLWDQEDGANRIFHNNIVNNGNQVSAFGPSSNVWYEPTLLEGNYWSDYPGVDDGSGSGKHGTAGDGIGDTNLPWPGEGYDSFPFMEENGWQIHRPIAVCPPAQVWKQIVNGTASGTLDGSGSHDPGGQPLTYLWSSATCTFDNPSGAVTMATCGPCENAATLAVNNGTVTTACTTTALVDGQPPAGGITAPVRGACLGAQAGTQTLRIEALIDGHSQLVLKGNTAEWRQMEWAAPGRWEGRHEPTRINGLAWLPAWPDVPDSENRDCNCSSDVYSGISPALPAIAADLALRSIQARDSVSIAQYPAADNGFTTIVDFYDGWGGAEWYIVELDFSGMGSGVRIEDNYNDNCGGPITRVYDPPGGPFYGEHGDHRVRLTATDAAGNSASDTTSFTIDLIAPEVQILTPLIHAHLPPHGHSPFRLDFETGDEDGAMGGVVHEVVKLEGCALFDGDTFGDRDGRLSDERLGLTRRDLCRMTAACGLGLLDRPMLRVEASDCAGNIGYDQHRLQEVHLPLRPGLCEGTAGASDDEAALAPSGDPAGATVDLGP